MAFIQTISFSTSRIDEIQKITEGYQADTALGYRGSKLLKDRDRNDAYMVIAEFESHELAMQNSARPETDAFAKQMGELVDGEVTYGNYDVISEE